MFIGEFTLTISYWSILGIPMAHPNWQFRGFWSLFLDNFMRQKKRVFPINRPTIFSRTDSGFYLFCDSRLFYWGSHRNKKKKIGPLWEKLWGFEEKIGLKPVRKWTTFLFLKINLTLGTIQKYWENIPTYRLGFVGSSNNNNNRARVIAPHILVASSRTLYIITLTSTCCIPTHTSTARGN